jgi:xanthine dehydrogenase accessory factor
LKHATIAALEKARSERRAVAFAKRLTDGAEFLLPGPGAPESLNEAGLTALRQDKTGTQIISGEPWFIEARNPPPRLILVGAVHIAQALSPFAGMAGFEVIVVDPRHAFGNADRFPGIELMNEWPDTALQRLRPDAGTAIVTLTHDPKLDDPALDHALRTEAFYIGALGSRKTHTARLERLQALGHEPAALARIHGPVGLDIAAVTAAEIALSVIAEIVAIRRGGGILAARRA